MKRSRTKKLYKGTSKHGNLKKSKIKDSIDENLSKIKYSPLFEIKGLWYEQAKIYYDNIRIEAQLDDKNQIKNLYSNAEALLQRETNGYNSLQLQTNTSDRKWILTILEKGTLSDKLSACDVLIRESPIHHTNVLQKLLDIAVNNNSSRISLLACDTLKDIWLTILLPNRKLYSFDQFANFISNDANIHENNDILLIFAYFEQFLKDKYAIFIGYIQKLVLTSNLQNIKIKCLKYLLDLLIERPENEKILLSSIVNKIGDPLQKVSLTAQHLLSKLVLRIPNMKLVVVEEIELFLSRSNVSEIAQYRSFTFLNQIILANNDKELATRLISTYSTYFKLFISKKEINWKILSCFLTGLHRALPFADNSNNTNLETLIEYIFKMAHISVLQTSLQSILFLALFVKYQPKYNDRLFNVLYHKLLTRELVSTKKQFIFLKVLNKSLLRDISNKRIIAFVKRSLQVCTLHNVNFILAILETIKNINTTHHSIISTHLKYSHIDYDSDDEVYNNSNNNNNNNNDNNNNNTNNNINNNSDSNDDNNNNNNNNINNNNNKIRHFSKYDYNIQHRNPLYCNAEYSNLWELSLLSQHYNPKVSDYASNILNNNYAESEDKSYGNFTFIQFLDTFVN